MTSIPSIKKIISPNIKISCPQFVRFFLVRDAQLAGRNLNAHVNDIVKSYLSGKFLKLTEIQRISDFIDSAFLTLNILHIEIKLYQSVYKKLQAYDLESAKLLIETSIQKHIIFCLSENDKSEIYRKISQEICSEIAGLNSDTT